MKKMFVVKRIVNKDGDKTFITWDIYKRSKDSMEFIAEFWGRNHALISAAALNGELCIT